MARYRVLEKSFINNTIVDVGAEVDFDGEAGENLELIADETEAKGKKQKAASEDPAA